MMQGSNESLIILLFLDEKKQTRSVFSEKIRVFPEKTTYVFFEKLTSFDWTQDELVKMKEGVSPATEND